MNFIHSFIDKEVNYFRKLHQDGQKLLFGIFLNSLIDPMLGLFLNAFLWRQSHDIQIIAVYNLIVFSLITVGFYINGLLLKRFSPSSLFTIALGAFGLATSILIFLPTISYSIVILFGLIDGLCAGVYWANRNLLTLKTTQSDNRIYFSSLETSSGTITGVIVPLFIGWFIAFGSIIQVYSPVRGYQILSVGMLLIVAAIAIIMQTISIKRYNVGDLLIKKASSSWQKFQLFQLAWGLNEGATGFISILLVLILVGQEASLGTVQSISAIFTALIVFALAKFLHIKHRLTLIVVGVSLILLGATVFGILFSAVGVFILVATQALAHSIEWVAFSSLNYDLMEKDGNTEENHYAYVCDQEIYLNLGRIISVGIFMALVHFSSNTIALRYAPFIFGLAQILLIFTTRSIEKNLKTSA